MGRIKYGIGHRFGELVIVERLGNHRRSTWVRCECDCGEVRDFALQNLVSGATDRCSGPAHVDPRRKLDGLSYSAAHHRVNAERGPAKARTCELCGERQASGWAYTHSDPGELTEPGKRDRGAYSLHPELYLAACKRCHGRLDRARATLPAGLSLPHHARALATLAGAALALGFTPN